MTERPLTEDDVQFIKNQKQTTKSGRLILGGIMVAIGLVIKIITLFLSVRAKYSDLDTIGGVLLLIGSLSFVWGAISPGSDIVVEGNVMLAIGKIKIKSSDELDVVYIVINEIPNIKVKADYSYNNKFQDGESVEIEYHMPTDTVLSIQKLNDTDSTLSQQES